MSTNYTTLMASIVQFKLTTVVNIYFKHHSRHHLGFFPDKILGNNEYYYWHLWYGL